MAALYAKGTPCEATHDLNYPGSWPVVSGGSVTGVHSDKADFDNGRLLLEIGDRTCAMYQYGGNTVQSNPQAISSAWPLVDRRFVIVICCAVRHLQICTLQLCNAIFRAPVAK